MLKDIMPTSLKKRRVIYLPDGLWEKLIQESQEKQISISKLIRKKIRDSLNYSQYN
jgi:hypothetical protein